MIDASSTTYELAKLLADTTMELTIITNGLEKCSAIKGESASNSPCSRWFCL